MTIFKRYNGRVPACGVFCGGCPTFIRERKPCPGAEINSERCEKCKTFHLCCKEREITHCYQCDDFPCKKFKAFSKRWEKYGQNFLDNQDFIKHNGDKAFLKLFNSKVETNKNE